MLDGVESDSAIYPLDPLYINERRVAGLVGAQNVATELDRVSGWNQKLTLHLRAVRCAELLRGWLATAASEISPIQVLLVKNSLKPGMIFTYEGNMWFRNARGEKSGEPLGYAKLSQLAGDGGELRVDFRLHPSHVVVGSPGEHLRGQVSDLVALAQVIEVTHRHVVAVPIFIGYFRKQGPLEFLLPTGRNELYVDRIDNFSAVANIDVPKPKELDLLRGLPEVRVKEAFAEIIGEPDVQKDWGGERSDLYTTYLRVEGNRISAAFAFKGPAGGKKFREMQIADLGKNGDQIERMCIEPAELLVVQHCHKIGAAVRNTVRAFCNQVGRQRHYCLISGYDTIRVLRAYGKCGF